MRGSPEGAAGLSARRCVEPSTRPRSTVRVAARRPRAARPAQSGSRTRASRKESGSRPSTGQSSSRAISNATGVRFYSLPITPDKILEGLEKKRREERRSGKVPAVRP